MKYVYNVTGCDVFNRAINKKFYDRDAARLYVDVKRVSEGCGDLQIDEGIEFSSKEEEQALAKIMHDCYLRGFEAGFNLREVKGNEQK